MPLKYSMASTATKAALWISQTHPCCKVLRYNLCSFCGAYIYWSLFKGEDSELSLFYDSSSWSDFQFFGSKVQLASVRLVLRNALKM